MPRRKGPPVYAERGANPAQVALKVPEGWTGDGGRIAKAAVVDSKPTSAEWLRWWIEEGLKRAGV